MDMLTLLLFTRVTLFVNVWPICKSRYVNHYTFDLNVLLQSFGDIFLQRNREQNQAWKTCRWVAYNSELEKGREKLIGFQQFK